MTTKTLVLSGLTAAIIVMAFAAGYLMGYAAGERDRVGRDP
jgi:hypothetical protein